VSLGAGQGRFELGNLPAQFRVGALEAGGLCRMRSGMVEGHGVGRTAAPRRFPKKGKHHCTWCLPLGAVLAKPGGADPEVASDLVNVAGDIA